MTENKTGVNKKTTLDISSNFNILMSMIGSLYYVYSKDESNVDGFEGAFPTEEQAASFCSYLAAAYGPTLKQDLPEGERIVSIFYRREWQLK